jgi:S-adenosylmethionine:tRNA ribosyltransferase-isomerase
VRTSDFDYDLPKSFIAQHPAEPRDSSRLLVLDRKSGELADHVFRDLPNLLRRGDCLVINRTRVLPARLEARKLPGGGKAEILLLRRLEAGVWEAVVGGRGLGPGRLLALADDRRAVIEADLGGSLRRVRFDPPLHGDLERLGSTPLPPYITEPMRRRDDYQTVFAAEPGSAAAPTAGLHFTPRLVEELAAQGIDILEVTLHIGLDTFAPVREADPRQHAIHTEWCRLDPTTADALNRVRASGGRIVAVGTTSTRTLESAALSAPPGQAVSALEGPTDLYILPGHTFRAVDALITNFHLPRSTLLMLVSAFAGRETILAAYESAKLRGYRFYSFGDAMMIL